MEYLQTEIVNAVAGAKPKRPKKNLSVRTENGHFPLLKLWRDGFEVAEADAPHMRGHVDILDGEERLARCLIVFARAEFGVATYEFKRRTEARTPRPVDYAREDDAPVALLT